MDRDTLVNRVQHLQHHQHINRWTTTSPVDLSVSSMNTHLNFSGASGKIWSDRHDTFDDTCKAWVYCYSKLICQDRKPCQILMNLVWKFQDLSYFLFCFVNFVMGLSNSLSKLIEALRDFFVSFEILCIFHTLVLILWYFDFSFSPPKEWTKQAVHLRHLSWEQDPMSWHQMVILWGDYLPWFGVTQCHPRQGRLLHLCLEGQSLTVGSKEPSFQTLWRTSVTLIDERETMKQQREVEKREESQTWFWNKESWIWQKKMPSFEKNWLL